MNKTINVAVEGKIAHTASATQYVCGNSDFVVAFAFDDEWNEHEYKTARFAYNGTWQDVVFTGNICRVPVISNTHNINVGVYAGDLHTTTPAHISAKKSILCGGGVPADPAPDVYAQLMELINNFSGVDEETVQKAVAEYLTANPIKETDPTVPDWAKQKEKPTYTASEVGALSSETLPEAVNQALAKAKASGEFDGADGKDGQPGKDGEPGKDGAPGAPGKDGYTPVKGVDYFDGKDGKDGKDGSDGSPGKDGENGQDGYSPVRGTDYWTDDDIAEIKSYVDEAILGGAW